MEKTLSVHKIIDYNDFDFNINLYSRFKYGCWQSARIIAEEMANLLIKHDSLYNFIDDETEVCIASPAHRKVPTSANLLTEFIGTMLNWHFHEKGRNPVEFLRISREKVYADDYATLSVEERKTLLSSEVMSVDEKRVRNKFIIFVDDIIVTGTHQKLVEDMINTYPHKGHIFLNYVEVSVPMNPNIEDKLNKHYVKGYKEMLEILNSQHVLNARMIKDILRLDSNSIVRFRELASFDLLMNIINSAIVEGYDRITELSTNFKYIKSKVTYELRSQKATRNYSQEGSQD